MKSFNEEDEENQRICETEVINGEKRLKQPQEARITVEKQESTPEKQESPIKMMIGEEKCSGEKRLQNRYGT
jgi:hypothetical protein